MDSYLRKKFKPHCDCRSIDHYYEKIEYKYDNILLEKNISACVQIAIDHADLCQSSNLARIADLEKILSHKHKRLIELENKLNPDKK